MIPRSPVAICLWRLSISKSRVITFYSELSGFLKNASTYLDDKLIETQKNNKDGFINFWSALG